MWVGLQPGKGVLQSSSRGGAVSHHDNQHSIIDFWLNSESEKNEDLKNLDRPAGGLWSDSNKRRMEEKVDGVRNL